MAKLRVVFDVQKGRTLCHKCPFASDKCGQSFVDFDCEEYDLSTLITQSIEEEE